MIAHRDNVTKAILHGLSGPLDGRTYAEVMAPMGASSDRWIADVASFIRNAFGNSSSIVSEADVARVRKETAGREKMWTAEELERTQPRPLVPDITWDATASHNTAAADGAFDYARWSSEAPQQPGMWFIVELPDARIVSELQFESPMIGGGRSGAPAVATSPRAFRVEVSSDGKAWTRLQKARAAAGPPRSALRRCVRSSSGSRRQPRRRMPRPGRCSGCASINQGRNPQGPRSEPR